MLAGQPDSRGNSKALSCPLYYILYGLGKGTMGNFQGRRNTLLSEKRDNLPSGNDFILWEADHLSSGKRDMGNRTRYPLGFGPLILWETSSGNWEFGNRFLTLVISSEFKNHALNTEFLAAVGMLRKKSHLKAETLSKLGVYSQLWQKFSRAKLGF